LLRSVKSTHILHLPLLFLTITTLASHSGYLISSINYAFLSLATSSPTASLLSSPCFLLR
jgi:hypothetical protein